MYSSLAAASNPALAAALREISATGRLLTARDMVPANSGSLSRRLDGDWAAITRAGSDKGDLTDADIVTVPLTRPLPSGLPNGAPLHTALYRSRPQMAAVLHVHSVAATVVSQLHEAEGRLCLRGFEMQKALTGQTNPLHEVSVLVLPNIADTDKLADTMADWLSRDTLAVGVLLAGHGLYAWGASMAEAWRHVQAFEFLFKCELEKVRVRR
jgi:methylthioribulose-1-phosphate dehydratase